MKEDKTIYNCHTHIFTIDHVPNEFARTFVPRILSKIITIRLVKWYYTNFTSRGSKRYKQFIHFLKKVKFGIIDFFKWTLILYWVYFWVFFIIKWLFNIVINFLKIEYLFSKELKQIRERFMTMGRYSINYKTQGKVFDLLEKTYAKGTKFVVLSMDMDYMKAGKAVKPYLEQIEDLKKVKRNNPEMLPFLFLDPRRVAETKHLSGKRNYLNFLKSELQKRNFNGIKLYPALGYYPFDKDLIDSFLFAQKYQIPIMTHCIEGTVFYRGGEKRKNGNITRS